MGNAFRLRRVLALSALAALLAACGSTTPTVTSTTTSSVASTTASSTSSAAPTSSSSSAPSSTSGSSSSGTTTGAAEISTATGDLSTGEKGAKFLVGAEGKTLYMFTTDSPGKTSCAGQCLAAWPPLYATTLPTVADGIDASKLKLVDVADGKKQVQYGDWLLYYYAKDTKAGDTVGQDVGKKWYVVGTDGEPIGRPAAAATSSS